MSYPQPLEGIFTTIELNVLSKIMEFEALTVVMRDDLTSDEKRAIKSIRDKLRGKQNISSPHTTAPSKL